MPPDALPSAVSQVSPHVLPRVSVVIPLYNKQRQIERAVDSIFNQSFQDFELVIVDDGSTDASVDTLAKSKWFRDPRFRLVQQRNAGPGRARNEGARAAHADLVAFLDADDEWHPGHLHRAVEALARTPSCRVYVAAYDTGRFERIQQNLLVGLVDQSGPWELPLTTGPVALKAAVDACHSSCLVMDRATFLKFGGYYEKNRCTFGEDAYLMLQLVLSGPVFFEREAQVLFHVEDSELGAQRVGSHPMRPHLSDPEPLRRHCPPDRLNQLNALLSYYRLLETEKLSREGDWGAVLSMRKKFPWPTPPTSDLRMREIKTPWRAFARSLQHMAFPARAE